MINSNLNMYMPPAYGDVQAGRSPFDPPEYNAQGNVQAAQAQAGHPDFAPPAYTPPPEGDHSFAPPAYRPPSSEPLALASAFNRMRVDLSADLHNLANPQVDLSNLRPQQMDLNVDLAGIHVPIGVDPATLNAIDLAKFRSSNLSSKAYWLLALPVIGWVALGCMKIRNKIDHSKSEKILRASNFDIATVAEKIQILTRVVERKGCLAWQYQLELARLQLLNGNTAEANTTLQAVHQKRSINSFAGVKGYNFVYYDTKYNWRNIDQHQIKIIHRTAEEALLHASVCAANDRLDEAYHSYNQAIFYDTTLQNRVRPLQIGLVTRMEQLPLQKLTSRHDAIISAEHRHRNGQVVG